MFLLLSVCHYSFSLLMEKDYVAAAEGNMQTCSKCRLINPEDIVTYSH